MPKRPDADNVRKAVLDSLRSFWRDDSIVVSGSTFKIYGREGQQPCVRVLIRSAGEMTDPHLIRLVGGAL